MKISRSIKIITNTRDYRTTAVNSNRYSCQKRRLLERLVIKGRGGESLGNANRSIYRPTNILSVDVDEWQTQMSWSDRAGLVTWCVWKTEKNGSVQGNLRTCPDELEHESLCFRAGLEKDVETWMRSKRAMLMTHPLQLLVSSESNPASSLPAFQLFLSDRGHEKTVEAVHMYRLKLHGKCRQCRFLTFIQGAWEDAVLSHLP